MEQENYDVVVVGSIMIDLNAYAKCLPKPNETIFGTAFMQSFGGKGSNQAVQCAKLGRKVAMLGRVGNDNYGNSYLQQYEKEKVNFIGKMSNDNSTGIAHITIGEDGSNFITIIQGSNMDLSVEDVNDKKDIISNSKILICQNEIPKESTLHAMKLARDNNVCCIYNPAPAEQMNNLLEILKLSDIVVPNEVELSTLTGLPTTSQQQIQIAAKFLMEQIKCKVVIVTLGEKGCCLLTDDICAFIHTDEVQAIDCVGAGDSFIGTLGVCISCFGNMETSSLLEAITKALFVASNSTTRTGAQISYCSLIDLPSDFLPVL